MGRRKNGGANADRNRYAHLRKPLPLPELPRDVIDKIVLEHTDTATRTRCKALDKAFLASIGDTRPTHIRHQQHMIGVIEELCSSDRYSYFNLSINSPEYRVIVLDADDSRDSRDNRDNRDSNDHDIVFRVIKKGVAGRTTTRRLRRSRAADEVRALFKRPTVFKGAGMASKALFETIFSGVYAANLEIGRAHV